MPFSIKALLEGTGLALHGGVLCLSDEEVARRRHERLRLDLNHEEYARWVLSGKIVQGTVRPEHYINDFVLFRLAHEWPGGADWSVQNESIDDLDFSLTEDMAADLADMGREGLTDGNIPADAFLRQALLWHAYMGRRAPRSLIEYGGAALFGPPSKGRGRKKASHVDRNLIISATFLGLQERECGADAAQKIIAQEINMTQDAVRKLLKAAPLTDRERRLWEKLRERETRRAIFD